MYVERTYRNFQPSGGLVAFTVKVEQTDLYVKASKLLQEETEGAVRHYRRDIEHYITSHPEFLSSLESLPLDPSAPAIVQNMLHAAQLSRVGPMACVAGAIAELVGRDLLLHTHEVVVENGGDIFLRLSRDATVEIFAGPSPLSSCFGIVIKSSQMPAGICTSSKSVGPSLSFGNTDAVSVLSSSAALADGMATAIGNAVKTPSDINIGIELAQRTQGVEGVVIIIGKNMGIWGDIELVPLEKLRANGG